MALATQYWCSKKIVVTVKTGQKTVERVLPKPFAVVGRDPNCDLVLEDPELRGHLFYLHANEYGLYCTPINSDSDSGTIPQGWLGPDDLITCGGFQLSAHLEGQDTESGLPSPSWPRLSEYGSTLPPLPIVAIYRKGKFLAQRRIRAQLTLVGRNQPSLIRIPSRSLSRCHCALFWEAGTLWFVDLKSRSHCLVEGLKRQAGRFEPGLRLQVGQYELEYLGQEGIQSFPGQAAQTGDADHGSRGFEELSSSHRIPGPPISDLEGHDLDDQDSREKQQLLEELGEAKRVQEMLQTRLDELGKIEERHAEHLSEQQSNYRQLQESHQRLQGDYEQLELELKGRDEAAVGRHEELQKQTDKLIHQLAESQKTAQEKSELVSEQAERLVSIEGDFEELQKQFEKSRALDQELREEAKELKKRLGEAESLVEQREAELKITREEIRDLNLIRQEWIEGAGESESQLSELQVQLAAQKVAVEEAVEEAERQLREIETERDELRTANLNLCEDLKTLRAQLEEMGELEKRNVELVSELGSLQERLDERSQASETDRLDWSEKVETLQAELMESKALQDRERQQADENRDELSKELEELQQRFDQQLTEISRIQDDSSRRQNELEDRAQGLQASLEDAQAQSRQATEAASVSKIESEELRAKLQESDRQLQELKTELEAGLKTRAERDQLGQELTESRAANEDALRQNQELEKILTELRQELEIRNADVDARSAALKRERQEHAAEMAHWKEALKDAQIELESERQRRVIMPTDGQVHSLSKQDGAILDSESPKDEHPVQEPESNDTNPAMGKEDAGPSLIPREQDLNPGEEYVVSELTSRLSVFGRTKKGRWLTVRKALIALAWLVALTLTGGLVYLIVKQLLS